MMRLGVREVLSSQLVSFKSLLFSIDELVLAMFVC